MGLAGDDDFRLKVSPDGAAWHDALTVDRNTGLCRLEKIAFEAHLSADQISGPSNVITTLNFDSTLFNTGQYFDTATGRFTPPAGYYALNVLIYYKGAEDNVRAAFGIQKNGVLEKIVYRAASGTDDTSLQISTVVYANGTDYFEAGVRILGTGTKTIVGSQYFTHFQGHAL